MRLTNTGPRVVEINARIGGDRIPHVAEAATGIQAAPAAAAIACGRAPALSPTRRRVAAIRLAYPARDAVAKAIRVDRGRLPSTVDCVETIAAPGQELRLPPAGHVTSRYAFVTVVAETVRQCLADADTAVSALTVDVLG